MNHIYDQPGEDFIRARFTSWLNTTLIRARQKYLAKQKQKLDVISLDELPADLLEDPYDYFTGAERSQVDFIFEEEKLAKAFYDLPLMRREVLRLLFVEEKTPEEISKQLLCSVNYVHQQKSRALKKLRKVLLQGGDGSLD